MGDPSQTSLRPGDEGHAVNIPNKALLTLTLNQAGRSADVDEVNGGTS